ncbi:MAG: hypothetical protein HQK49_00285 [Oligoflexia bacterium]|nr:hypothetical protein [Oligoflexia bacterium]
MKSKFTLLRLFPVITSRIIGALTVSTLIISSNAILLASDKAIFKPYISAKITGSILNSDKKIWEDATLSITKSADDSSLPFNSKISGTITTDSKSIDGGFSANSSEKEKDISIHKTLSDSGFNANEIQQDAKEQTYEIDKSDLNFTRNLNDKVISNIKIIDECSSRPKFDGRSVHMINELILSIVKIVGTNGQEQTFRLVTDKLLTLSDRNSVNITTEKRNVTVKNSNNAIKATITFKLGTDVDKLPPGVGGGLTSFNPAGFQLVMGYTRYFIIKKVSVEMLDGPEGVKGKKFEITNPVHWQIAIPHHNHRLSDGTSKVSIDLARANGLSEEISAHLEKSNARFLNFEVPVGQSGPFPTNSELDQNASLTSDETKTILWHTGEAKKH